MTRAPVNDVIASRKLGIEGSNNKVVVEIRRPKRRDMNFACPYRITYGARVINREICGVDEFQALQLALRTLAVELHYNKNLPIGRMYWLEKGNDIGFVNPEQGK